MQGAAKVVSRVELEAVLFDMDGVVTRTATVHAAAWKQVFDAFLTKRAGPGRPFTPFDPVTEYLSYVDGKPRYDGVVSFLSSRGISLPYGSPADAAGSETVCAVGNCKDAVFQRLIQEGGVEAFESTVHLLSSLRQAGLKTGVFSASRHAEQVLSTANVFLLFNAKVDGIDAEGLGLPGKPDPATLLELSRRLGVQPSRAAVIEDAVAGVQAGRAGLFALVIGVNRSGRQGLLLENGADVEVTDLAEVRLEKNSIVVG